MAALRRIERINQVIREEVTKILDRELEFPEGALVTVTRVSASPDARHASVFFSVLGAAPGDALAILEKNVYHIQQMVNRRLRMRPVPKIRFIIDEGERRREQVERSLGALKQTGGV